MSRSGYSDDIDDHWSHIRWRGMVASATRGKRGQRLLLDMLTGMDAMPVKKLIAHELVSENGECCALGACANWNPARHSVNTTVDPDDYDMVAAEFDIAAPLAQEIVYYNDEMGGFWRNRPEALAVVFGPHKRSAWDWPSLRVEAADETPRARWERMRAWAIARLNAENREAYLNPAISKATGA